MNTNGIHDMSSPHTTGLNWSTICSSSHFMYFLYIIFITLQLQASDLLTDDPLDSYMPCIISGPLPTPALVMWNLAMLISFIHGWRVTAVHWEFNMWTTFWNWSTLFRRDGFHSKAYRSHLMALCIRTCTEVLPVLHIWVRPRGLSDKTGSSSTSMLLT